MAAAKPVARRRSQGGCETSGSAEERSPAVAAKAAAASAGWAGPAGNTPKTPYLDPSSQFVTSCVKATVEAAVAGEARCRRRPWNPKLRHAGPEDPCRSMMEESRQAGAKGLSFSEISELPPLKEVYIDPSPAAEDEDTAGGRSSKSSGVPQ